MTEQWLLFLTLSNEMEVVTLNSSNRRLIKRMLNEHGTDVCRNEYSAQFIRTELDVCDVGFFAIGTRPRTGLRDARLVRSSSPWTASRHINGFVFATLRAGIGYITLICGRRTMMLGPLLLSHAEDYAKTQGIDTVMLESGPEEALRRFYTLHGYVVVKTNRDKHTDAVKGVWMQKIGLSAGTKRAVRERGLSWTRS
jgi:hypothetical protein